MKKIIIAILLTFFSLSLVAQPNIRQNKWCGDINASVAFVPNIFVQGKEQIEIGANFGRELTSHFYLGVGAAWLQYFNDANTVPLYLNPRVYFSKNVNSWFMDFRLGILTYSPEKEVNGGILRTDAIGPYGALAIGHSFSKIMLSLGVNIYPVINETQKSDPGYGSAAYACSAFFVMLAHLLFNTHQLPDFGLGCFPAGNVDF